MARCIRLWRARTAHEVTCVIGQPLVEDLFAEAGQHVGWMLEKRRCEGSLRSDSRQGVVSGVRSSTWQANCSVAAVPTEHGALVVVGASRSTGRLSAPRAAPCVST